jgi:hypothetical protein
MATPLPPVIHQATGEEQTQAEYPGWPARIACGVLYYATLGRVDWFPRPTGAALTQVVVSDTARESSVVEQLGESAVKAMDKAAGLWTGEEGERPEALAALHEQAGNEPSAMERLAAAQLGSATNESAS